MSARGLLAACAALAAVAFTNTPTLAAPEMVAFTAGYRPGTIVVNTSQRRLYLVLGGGAAVRYPVGVGKAGKQWAGVSHVDGKYSIPPGRRRPISRVNGGCRRPSSPAARRTIRWASRR